MKILMVCLGNICRSPMAEGVMKSLLKERKVSGWEVDSAGIGDWHVGEKPDHRAIRCANYHGIDISDQRARLFTALDFELYDYILVMDVENLKDARRKANNKIFSNKVNLLLDFSHPGQNEIVPDPYFTNRFEEAYELIVLGCVAFLDKMEI